MAHSYSELYISKARDSLGRMLEFAVHDLHMNAADIFALFISTGVAADFGRGDVRTIAGMSGVELSYAVLDRSGIGAERIRYRYTSGRSGEYRAGSILAYAQWEHCVRFEDITECISISSIVSMYEERKSQALEGLSWTAGPAERTAAIESMAPDFDTDCLRIIADRLTDRDGEARLKAMRIRNGLSQSQLAAASGVPLRTLQQYEQRQKDIRKAGVQYVTGLASALHCEPGELLELGS